MDHSLWQSLQVSEKALENLRLYAEMTEKWTVKINLISKSTIPDIWARHIEDSARIALHMPQNPKLWADFGSGGGFPGLVLATIMADLGWQTRMVLVESDQRKSTFLREVARKLSLPVEVRAERAELIDPLDADVVSARALASLSDLCVIWQRHGAENSLGLFPKGERWQEEVAQARENWQFDLDAKDDPGHSGSAILLMRNLRRVSRDD